MHELPFVTIVMKHHAFKHNECAASLCNNSLNFFKVWWNSCWKLLFQKRLQQDKARPHDPQGMECEALMSFSRNFRQGNEREFFKHRFIHSSFTRKFKNVSLTSNFHGIVIVFLVTYWNSFIILLSVNLNAFSLIFLLQLFAPVIAVAYSPKQWKGQEKLSLSEIPTISKTVAFIIYCTAAISRTIHPCLSLSI